MALAIVGAKSPASAQVEAQLDLSTSSAAAGESRVADRWFIGGYYRHLWVPFYMTEPFFDLAPSVTNHGGGLLLTYRTEGGLNLIFGGGYMPYTFSGLILEEGKPATDAEHIDSEMGLVHLTGQLLWDVPLGEMFALELGFALDMGIFVGDVVRNEAYFDPAAERFFPCTGALDPPIRNADGDLYCAMPENGRASDDPGDEGEHYDAVDDNLPPAFPFPSLPMVALRFNPHRHVGIKAEFGFGIVQLWAGASLHVSFGLFAGDPAPKPVPVVEPDPEPAQIFGRVLGQVFERESKTPVAEATVRVLDSAMSPLSTVDDGRFVFDRLDPGHYRFQIEHPDYDPATCEVTIGPEGGDAPVHCMLEAGARKGAISGQVKDDKGSAVAVPNIEISGPETHDIGTDGEGIFGAVDLPPGTYRIRIDADGYLLHVLEVEVLPNETAMPSIVLIPKPKKQLVTVKKSEIVIREQINFATGSADIEESSHALMTEIADVLMRNEHITLVEIQGHTDSRGKRDYNQKLSEDRAGAVRDWLVRAGVDSSRLLSKGYGPDHPLRPNNTKANRAKNRRVQFIIQKQN